MKNKKTTRTVKILNFIVIGLMLAIMTKAAVFTYEKDSVIDLKVPCVNDGSPCSTGATCNITITKPDSTPLFFNTQMTNSGNFHNITFENTSATGEYTAVVYCIDGSHAGHSTFMFSIIEPATKNLRLISDSKWFNFPAFDISTTAGVFMLIFTFFIFIALIIFSEHMRVAALILLTGIYGFFLSWLYYVALSPVLGVIFAIVSVAIIGQSFTVAKE